MKTETFYNVGYWKIWSTYLFLQISDGRLKGLVLGLQLLHSPVQISILSEK